METKVQEIAEKTRDDLLDQCGFETAEEIHEGYCTDFVKRMTDLLKESGINSVIVVTDNFELMDELEGYEITESNINSMRNPDSHCYVNVQGKFYDAFDTEGVEDENELKFLSL